MSNATRAIARQCPRRCDLREQNQHELPLRHSVDAGLIDLAWLDACPLLAYLRTDPRFIELRDQVAARVAPVLAALA